MSYYRNSYLKSGHWDNLRLDRIVKQKGRCNLCGVEGAAGLDVHHIQYRHLYDVKQTDLRALCRECHNLVHFVLEHENTWKTFSSSNWRWGWTKTRARTVRKFAQRTGYSIALSMQALYFQSLRTEYKAIQRKFLAVRKVIQEELGLSQHWREFQHSEMPWCTEAFHLMHNLPRRPTSLQIYLRFNQMRQWKDCWPCGEH